MNGYRLISGRSQDRNLLPVSIQFGCFIEAPRHSFGDAKHEHINNRYSVNGNTRFTLGSELQDQRLVTGIIHNTLHLFTVDSGHS